MSHRTFSETRSFAKQNTTNPKGWPNLKVICDTHFTERGFRSALSRALSCYQSGFIQQYATPCTLRSSDTLICSIIDTDTSTAADTEQRSTSTRPTRAPTRALPAKLAKSLPQTNSPDPARQKVELELVVGAQR